MAISEDTQAMVAAQLAAAWADKHVGNSQGGEDKIMRAYIDFRKRVVTAEKELLDERTGGAKSQVFFS